ncbi:HNH endonuclease [Acidovorax sp. HMWF018]|uniref:HNH endonuclease signature motif containing protein n=1 Tax=Acidovorax sp. HMWF018 TaxID=2056855 RepID=UPI000D3A67B2|nr:HNH endonuclease signature motif containing protein [Acidovorax sp. HMWF018]PTT41483.1 HNH endonuclease [Acidovorax sp. HMWF018]
MPKVELTAQRLREVLRYEPESGQMFWLIRAAHRRHPGEEAGSPSKDGRIRIRIDGQLFYRYRLAWLWMTGKWPDKCVDHINGDHTDDSWKNLRDVPQAINCQNYRKAPKSSSTGLLGAQALPNGRFESSVKTLYKRRYLGSFDNAQDAHEAYIAAKRELHPGFTL